METDPDNVAVATPDNSAGFVNPDGSFADKWTEKLGDDFKNDAPTLSRFKNVKDLSKSYTEARRKLGHDPETLVQIPRDDSPDEVKQAFWRAKGLPESPDKYEYKISDALKTKLGDVQPERMAIVQKFAHEKLHLNNKEFVELLDFYHNTVASDIDKGNEGFAEQEKSFKDKNVAELKKTFKDGLEQRTQRAVSVLTKYGDVPMKNEDGSETTLMERLFAENPKLKNSASMTMFLDNIAESMSEDSIKGFDKVSIPTSGQIETKISELRQHPGFMKEDHPDHNRILAEIESLYKKKHGA
jgi:hypothetical protein